MTPLPTWAIWDSSMVESYDIDSIDRSEVLRYMGYAGQSMTPELEGRIDGCDGALPLHRRATWRLAHL